MRYERSSKLFLQAKNKIPGGVNSPVRAFKSVGGQPTISNMLDLKKIALGFGFKKFFQIKNKSNFKKKLKKYIKQKGPSFIHIITKVGSLKKLERPSNILEIKHQFMG